MFPTRSVVARSASSSYVCLGCRMKTRKRLRHDDRLDPENGAKPRLPALEESFVDQGRQRSDTQNGSRRKMEVVGRSKQADAHKKTTSRRPKEETKISTAARDAAIARAKALFNDAADQAGAQFFTAKTERRVRHARGERVIRFGDDGVSSQLSWAAPEKGTKQKAFDEHTALQQRQQYGEAMEHKTPLWPSDDSRAVVGNKLSSDLSSPLKTVVPRIQSHSLAPKHDADVHDLTESKPLIQESRRAVDGPPAAQIEREQAWSASGSETTPISSQGMHHRPRLSPKTTLGDEGYDAMSRLIAASQPTTSARTRASTSTNHRRQGLGHTCTMARAYHTTSRLQRTLTEQARTTGQGLASVPPELVGLGSKHIENPHGIRAQLRRWQEMNADKDQIYEDSTFPDADDIGGDTTNNLTRLENPDNALRTSQVESEEDEREAMAHFMQAPNDEPNSGDFHTRFLKMGDLVEVEYLRSDAPSVVAIFVRRVGTTGLAQLYTLQGRWVHVLEKKLQYSIPGWVPESMVRPLLEHLPDPDLVETNLDELLDQAYMKDLSVPRNVASPLVTRMVQFQAEATEIYRRHARALDNAHELLAHESDLRYGSLVTAATTLLKIPAAELPVTGLFAVRQALSAAGFAFNIDRRSHRLTGYLQIRSKDSVKMVNSVRGWLREWQDDLALTATMSEAEVKRHKPRRGAVYVHDFLKKIKQIVLNSREHRDATEYGNIGPSKVRIPITAGRDSVRIVKEECFTDQDTKLVQFIESWSLSHMFAGLPRIESLPPLLLQAIGLYKQYELNAPTGMLLLQEIGTILPYENRVRFDQHLLLPSSQHSRPLQDLMAKLQEMANKHDFKDSMAGLRHDWGALPVYCIDDASAHEIDDGLSVEPISAGTNDPKEWWVHIHIANPTAFFERDHPMAKMARHMGESIYMPERTYMMLPRWATQRHFSLDRNRPCLTFSARLNDKGETLERKIRSGYIRKVLRLTRQEVAEVLDTGKAATPELVLTVGGDPPPDLTKRPEHGEITPEMAQQLEWLRMLGEKRSEVRRAAGGLFFDTHKPDIKVWQSDRSTGLAWDHPFRKGWRRVEGDPVIQMRTQGFSNWFAPVDDAVDVLVREMMLLACETAAAWCEERQIPAVFRGSLRRPDRVSPETYFEETLAPAVKASKNGEYPMHLGMKYLETFGQTGLSTKPFNHAILGMSHYGKVTSPLRRYGDMILHWQIEAALREEARTGQNLVTTNQEADRKFLPFSKNVLDTIIVGLQPRESTIMRAKQHAEEFWISQLLFRAHHFGEAELPKTVKAWVYRIAGPDFATASAMIVEWNVQSIMTKVSVPGNRHYEEARIGDLWECEIVSVDVFMRIPKLRALRLIDRVAGP
ncbi:3'-5' RNA exonuclease complex component [Recurvomyces mirabilis]|uniref:3'-5' RNA exonuclease complex component n=1 Tax=Recurvomyces mirabilis TaxID=574656 RepID=A0AAE0WRV0_9PEZI|nr:3'-5' RNA exonuclease complex component [Recurvomyces mirabilis]KAK5154483.1 3'-5' RNA exonuclease complex component [Recurvomyces mirabilis]